MKNLKIILGLLVVGILVVVASGIVTAAANDQAGQRVYVLTGNSVAKTILGVNHEFPGGFSTEVSPQLKVLSALGLIKTEPVQLYHITVKPFCGDGKCTGRETPETCPEDCVAAVCGNDIIEDGEQCGEPGLSDCLEGYVCENCKCVEETAPPERSCYPSVPKPWGIVMVNGGSGGAGVNVAVLDTGVNTDHLDLKSNIVDCKDATKRGIKEGCTDVNGHGTHVSGTILADGGEDGLGIFGVAPEAKLMAIKVCGGGGCWADDIAAGIEYATDNGADIISMSLGGNTESSLISDAINYAVGEGVLVIAAAGNDGPADGSIDYPGANINVIAVGAIDSGEAVPDWSSRGVNDGDYIIEAGEVEFGAPGVGVESTYKNGCYASGDGTSMATPHIAGLAAKLWQGNAINTRSYLQSIATDIWITEDDSTTYEDERDDTATGFGLPIAPTE